MIFSFKRALKLWAAPALFAALPAAAQVRVSAPVLPSAPALPALSAAPEGPQAPGAALPALSAPSSLPSLDPLSPLSLPGPETGNPGAPELSKPLPQVDFSAFKPEAFKNASEGRAKEDGEAVFQELLGQEARRAKGGVDAASVDALKTPNRREADVYSNHRLETFEWDPESFALQYLLEVPENGPKAMDFVVGLSVHETMEQVYRAVQQGEPGEHFTLDKVLSLFDANWKKLSRKGEFVPKEGFTADDYRRRAESFLRRRHARLYPFNTEGSVHSVEKEIRFELKDPSSGRTYKFKGTPDRVMVQGGTVFIHDWKTHLNPPGLDQLRRDNYQLALYAIGLRQLQPELFKDKKIVLVWDFKEFSHHIEADEAYLKEAEQRVLRVLHGIESFTQRFESERSDWERRAAPAAKPSGLKEALKQVDQLGRLDSRLKAKRLELRELDRSLAEKEAGLAAYAKAKGLDVLQGKAFKAEFKTKSEVKLPTRSSDADAHDQIAKILKDAGLWKDYSSLDYTALKDAAEIQGHPDHALFEKLQGLLKLRHENELKVEENEERLYAQPGVTPYRLHPAELAEIEPEPGLYSVSRVALFERDPQQYALRYLFGVKEMGPKDFVLAVGLACHQTLEVLFKELKAGKNGRDIRLKDVLELYRAMWKDVVSEAKYKGAKGWTASDYRRKGEEFITAKYEQLHPFEAEGEILYLERRLPFVVKDPETGKVYRFQGIPDRVMVQGDTVVIHDWKTHFVPKSEEELRNEDFQLGMYAFALRQQFPQLMAGKKIRLMWDFKDRSVVIDADEAYLRSVHDRVVRLMRDIEAFTARVNGERGRWEDLAGKRVLPKSDAAARSAVDEMGRLQAERAAKRAELELMTQKREPLVETLRSFALATGHWALEGAKYTASLRKKPVTEVPTKGSDAAAHAKIVEILKSAGAWDDFSQLNYAALRKAMSDSNNPNQEIFKKLLPLMQPSSETQVQIQPFESAQGKRP